jgi:hypothetical protein
LLDVNPAGWGQRQAKNPVESACASPARLFLDVIAATDMRVMRFYGVFIWPGGVYSSQGSALTGCIIGRYAPAENSRSF